jgi:uncharacterized protein
MTSPTHPNDRVFDTPLDGFAKDALIAQSETVIDVNEDAPAAEDTPQVKRRDISRQTPADRDLLIRFVVGPDGFIVPDLKETLPGRGLWVKSDSESLGVTIKKNLFSRAAKRAVKVPENLSELVQGLLKKRALEALGLARREGILISGFEKVATALKSSKMSSQKSTKVSWLIEALDGASDGRNKLMSTALTQDPPVKICGIFSNDELSLALGLENVIHLALPEGRKSQRFTREILRLKGFEPLFPVFWQERPFD